MVTNPSEPPTVLPPAFPPVSGAGRRSTSIRQKVLAFVSGLIVLSLLGSTISLYRITEVNRLLDAINRVSVPLGRTFTQMQSDAEVFRRELERGLGYSHWGDAHWRPRPIPRWVQDVLESEVARVKELVHSDINWASPESKAKWQQWAAEAERGWHELKLLATQLHEALEARDQAKAAQLYPRWVATQEEWRRQIQWGATEYERSLRQAFALAETRVAELRTGLEMVLIVVVSLSFLLLWLGERALRPMAELTSLARQIARRGLRREDKSAFPEVPLKRDDEVSQLAREFHRMATALLEREKTVELQKHRLTEQNRQLREMGELNSNILNSIESVLIVTDLDGRIAHCNPVAARWLLAPATDSTAEAGTASPAGDDPAQLEQSRIIGSDFLSWPRVRAFLWTLPGGERWLDGVREADGSSTWKLAPSKIGGRVFGGHLMSLKHESGAARGAIFVVDDLTDELDLQERLRTAENLAAVGRMSAQVAHEVRNPLHSLGLEAEMAAELAERSGQPELNRSLQSILIAVDRLEKITENYLKLSRLSSGERVETDLGGLLEDVLATYAPACEAQDVEVDWKLEARSGRKIFADRDLLEQVLGNLFRNALQAVAERDEHRGGSGDSVVSPTVRGKIVWSLGDAESGRVWLRIEDNGPGIDPEIRDRLFNPFVTTRAQGTGLGLSFVKKVIEDHGGSIRCLDRPVGQGAAFEIVLPPSPSLSPQRNSYATEVTLA